MLMSNAFIKAIRAFQKKFRNTKVEIRTIYALEWYCDEKEKEFTGLFNIEFCVLELDKYFSVNVRVENNDAVVDSDIQEC